MKRSEEQTDPLSLLANWQTPIVIGHDDLTVVMPELGKNSPPTTGPDAVQAPTQPTMAAQDVQERPRNVGSGKSPWWDRPTPGTFLRVLELFGAGLGVIALVYAVEQTKLAKTAFDDQRQASAWQILAIPGTGSTGKQYALSTLVGLGVQIADVDLNCETDQADPDQECIRAVDLSRANFVAPKAGVEMYSVGLKGAQLRNSTWENITVRNFDLSQSSFTGAEFRDNVRFEYGNMRDANFKRIALEGVFFSILDLTYASFAEVDFSNLSINKIVFNLEGNGTEYNPGTINVSGVSFCRMGACSGLTQHMVDQMWFYADNPPEFFGGADMAGLTIRGGCVAGPDGIQGLSKVFNVRGSDAIMPRSCMNSERVPVLSLGAVNHTRHFVMADSISDPRPHIE